MSTNLAESGITGRANMGGLKRLQLLLYGPPGTGKTIFAHQFPRTRTLDLDAGIGSVEWAIREGIIKKNLEDIVFTQIQEDYSEGGVVAVAEALDRATRQIDEWLKDDDWDTLITDSASALLDVAMNKALDENSRLGLSRTKQNRPQRIGVTPIKIQDWGSAMNLLQQYINWIRSLDKNIILICHEYLNTNDDGVLQFVEPLLIGQMRQKIVKDFDEVWYSRASGSITQPKFEIQTRPDPKKRLRSRLGCLAPREPMDYLAIRKKVADFYEVPEESLWTGGSDEVIEDAVQV